MLSYIDGARELLKTHPALLLPLSYMGDNRKTKRRLAAGVLEASQYVARHYYVMGNMHGQRIEAFTSVAKRRQARSFQRAIDMNEDVFWLLIEDMGNGIGARAVTGIINYYPTSASEYELIKPRMEAGISPSVIRSLVSVYGAYLKIIPLGKEAELLHSLHHGEISSYDVEMDIWPRKIELSGGIVAVPATGISDGCMALFYNPHGPGTIHNIIRRGMFLFNIESTDGVIATVAINKKQFYLGNGNIFNDTNLVEVVNELSSKIREGGVNEQFFSTAVLGRS